MDPIPSWMNPDLLYRLNYGPIHGHELDQVATFVTGTYHDRIRALDCEGMYPVVHRSWRNILPFARQPVLDTVETSPGQIHSRQTYLKQNDTIWLGLIDPVLSRTLLSKIYPNNSHFSNLQAFESAVYGGFRYRINFEDTNIARLLELELFENFGKFIGYYPRIALMPLGAAIYDVLRVIDQLKQNAYVVRFKGSGSLDTCSGEDQYYSSREDVISSNPSVACGNSLERPNAELFLKKTKQLILFSRFFSEFGKYSFENPIVPNVFESLLQGDHMSSTSPNGNVAESQAVNLSSLDASFICSGPFRLVVTCLPERHLHLDADGILHIYLPPANFWWVGDKLSRLTIFQAHFFWDHERAASR
jgi:hypothetical protein